MQQNCNKDVLFECSSHFFFSLYFFVFGQVSNCLHKMNTHHIKLPNCLLLLHINYQKTMKEQFQTSSSNRFLIFMAKWLVNFAAFLPPLLIYEPFSDDIKLQKWCEILAYNFLATFDEIGKLLHNSQLNYV